ncbi:MAG TPA: hypothetical protein VLX59_10930 [Acidimicrobiales bacterium]|nr:hypothetical protein [Acidimicrobiales bacterium]
MAKAGFRIGVIAVVIARPWLWPVLIRLVPRRWWRRWPPLPLPPPEYIRFRTETMYGDPDGLLDGADLIAYLQWCRRMGSRAR